MLREVFKEQVYTFKETIAEDRLLQASCPVENQETSSFGDNLRYLGSGLAHQALDAVDQLTGIVPQLLEEIKDLRQFLPEGVLPPAPDHEILDGYGGPQKNHENLIALGHEKIDQLFSTDQAQRYTQEGKEASAASPKGQWTIASLPLPGTNLKMNDLTKAGKILDKGEFSKAGRSLTKHGYREGSVFPKPIGNPAEVNAQGQQVLESILNHPEKKIIPGEYERYGKVIDIYAPNIGGVRYSAEGEFIGFLEP